MRAARLEAFVEELPAAVAVHPLTTDIARLAGRLDARGKPRNRDSVDLPIGAPALSPAIRT